MKYIRRLSPAVVAFMLFALLCAGAFIQAHKKSPALRAGSNNLSAQQAFWEGRITKVGGTAAYQEFAESVATGTPQSQHAQAHVFGSALYQAEGLPGLATCDSRFSFGCYHEFLGRAISSLGLAVVAQLNDACFQVLSSSPLSCQHGIGHGIIADLGYDASSLDKALAVCKDLPHSDPIGGCYGGVFMEYNLQTMLGEEGRIRPATADLLAPCDRESAVYQPACYFWQPQWWRQNLRTQGVVDNKIAYSQIGALCAQAPANMQRSCFEGIGNNIPADAEFDANTARTLCIAATRDPQHQLWCRSLVADSLFVGGAGKKGDALAVCKGLSAEAYRYCASYAKNEANLAAPAETPSFP